MGVALDEIEPDQAVGTVNPATGMVISNERIAARRAKVFIIVVARRVAGGSRGEVKVEPLDDFWGTTKCILS